MNWGKAKSKIANSAKASGKKLIAGEYQVGKKLNRVGSAARTVGNNFVNDFQGDGLNFSTPEIHESPFRMGNTAEVLPALQRNQQRQHPRHRHQNRHKRHPRKVVYY